MNKYRNKICSAMKYTFRSKAERNHALWLESEKQSGRIKDWEYEKRFAFIVNGKTVAHHKPDFLVTLNDNRQEIHEVKSPITKTDGWHIRKNLFEALFPEIPYKVIMTFKNWS